MNGYLDELAPFGDAEFDLMKEHIQRVMHSSKKSDWRTPTPLYNALDEEFGFTVDVAANAASCLVYVRNKPQWFGPDSAHTDGLAAAWAPMTCFMNPPYQRGNKALGIPSEPIEPWIEKAWQESREGATVVGVLPFNPQTGWFRHYVYGEESEPQAAAEVRILPHRVTFNRPNGEPADNAPGNTCVVVWRPMRGFVWPWQPTFRYWSYR